MTMGELSNGHGEITRKTEEPFLPDHHLPLAEVCARIHSKVTAFLNTSPKDEATKRTQEQTRISIDVIRKALDRYELPAISLSYNGGKDCLVLLILYLAALASHPALKSTPSSLQTVYIISQHPFVEVESFVQSTSQTYNLSLTRYDKPMKAAFADYLAEFPSVKAIFVGTRRTDPHGAELTHFDPTDHGWPSFMRVHPVIDWHYVEIWTFIRHLRIPYCPLYDQGYTSLGGTTDTHPNPALRRESVSRQGRPQVAFLPAYELMEDGEERLGREREWRATKGTAVMHRTKGSANDVAVFDDDDDDI